MSTWFQTVRDLTEQLVRWPSVTNSPDESAWSSHLRDLLAQEPYFQANPDHLRLQQTIGDRYERHNLIAFVRGSGPETVILAGHYDVVSILNYGPLREWATNPAELTPRLIAALEASARSAADQRALDDLRSGDFMPGRGALDMKSGLAAGLAVLKAFAAQAERAGNLLFVATPDEEESSQGMCSLAAILPELAREWELDVVGAINLDASSDDGDGSKGQVVYLGSVGKFLPAVYVVGRDTHAGYPFEGISATGLAAAIISRIEGNVDLCDAGGGEVAPPPVTLSLSDLKPYYDVTVPGRAWICFNYLTHGASAAQVLARFTAEVRAALEQALAAHRAQALRFAERSGASSTPDWPLKVLSYAELYAHAKAAAGPSLDQALANMIAALERAQALDAPRLSQQVIDYLWNMSGLTGPAAVIALGSLHYPHATLSDGGPRHKRLERVAAAHASALSAESGYAISLRPFFAGISDMSFLGGALTPADQELVAANTPLWGSRIRCDYAAIAALNIPVINIGPWGREYHQRNERVFMPYSFAIAPELIWRVANELLAPEPPPA